MCRLPLARPFGLSCTRKGDLGRQSFHQDPSVHLVILRVRGFHLQGGSRWCLVKLTFRRRTLFMCVLALRLLWIRGLARFRVRILRASSLLIHLCWFGRYTRLWLQAGPPCSPFQRGVFILFPLALPVFPCRVWLPRPGSPFRRFVGRLGFCAFCCWSLCSGTLGL